MSKEIEQRLDRLEKRLDSLIAMIQALDETVNAALIQRPDERILGAKEVAEMISTELEELYRLCRNGEIPSFKIGKYYKFRKTEIIDWMKNRKKDQVGSVDDFVNKYLQKHPRRG